MSRLPSDLINIIASYSGQPKFNIEYQERYYSTSPKTIDSCTHTSILTLEYNATKIKLSYCYCYVQYQNEETKQNNLPKFLSQEHRVLKIGYNPDVILMWSADKTVISVDYGHLTWHITVLTFRDQALQLIVNWLGAFGSETCFASFVMKLKGRCQRAISFKQPFSKHSCQMHENSSRCLPGPVIFVDQGPVLLLVGFFHAFRVGTVAQ